MVILIKVINIVGNTYYNRHLAYTPTNCEWTMLTGDDDTPTPIGIYQPSLESNNLLYRRILKC